MQWPVYDRSAVPPRRARLPYRLRGRFRPPESTIGTGLPHLADRSRPDRGSGLLCRDWSERYSAAPLSASLSESLGASAGVSVASLVGCEAVPVLLVSVPLVSVLASDAGVLPSAGAPSAVALVITWSAFSPALAILSWY